MNALFNENERAHAGFTLLEVMIAMAMLSIAAMGLISAITTSLVLEDANRERAVVLQTARAKIEELQAECDEVNFKTIFSRRVNSTFKVYEQVGSKTRELADRKNGRSSAAGKILFPSSAGQLREDVLVPPGLGMKRDLNRDGTIDSLDHKSDYKLLPVIIRIEWTRPTGNEVVELKTILVRRY